MSRNAIVSYWNWNQPRTKKFNYRLMVEAYIYRVMKPKEQVIEEAIVNHHVERLHLGQSPTPLNRAFALRKPS